MPPESSTSGDPVSGWAGTASEKGHFRPDIEGLRAVAVVAVLLFHAGIPGFRGGFIGVDVFYVISGFLITGLLRRELSSSGRVDLVAFYARRARRLLPAALIVIAITLVASALILPRLRFTDVAVDGAWSALYVANYRFAFENLDYLTDVTVSPLLHYWSLSVEEQFYLFWPLILFAATRLFGLRRLAWVIVLIGVPSFVLAYVLTHVAAPLAFYSLPTRAWELAIGGMLAVLPQPLTKRLPVAAWQVIGWFGLALIGLSAVFINPDLGYPGLVALAPTTGAAMVIAAGAVGVGPTGVLSTAVPRYLGRISYSLYLWHWPILILIPIALAVDGLLVRIPLALLAIVVAHFSTRWIEQPFRLGGAVRLRPLPVVGLALLTSVALAGACFGAASFMRPSIRPTVAVAQVDADVADPTAVLASPRTSGPIPALLRGGLSWAARDLPQSRVDDCQTERLSAAPKSCVFGDPDSTTDVVLFGDSHAAQWLPALDELARERGWRLVTYIKSACPPADVHVWSDDLHRPFDECDEWRQNVLEKLAADRPEKVIVSGRRAYELAQDGALTTYVENPDAWREGLTRTLEAVAQASPSVVLLADTPAYQTSPIDCLAIRQTFEDCEAARDVAADPRFAEIEQAAATASGASYVSLSDVLCPTDVCALAFGDYLVYRDSAHLTATFARLLTQTLDDRIPQVVSR